MSQRHNHLITREINTDLYLFVGVFTGLFDEGFLGVFQLRYL